MFFADSPSDSSASIRTVHPLAEDGRKVSAAEVSKVPGLLRFSRVERGGEIPYYEIWWQGREALRMAENTREFAALGLGPAAGPDTVTDLIPRPPRPFWMHGSFLWSVFVAVIAFIGYTSTLNETWHWFVGSADGAVQVEVEETLKPRAVGTPFHLPVAVRNKKRFGTLLVDPLDVVSDPPSMLTVIPASATGAISIEPGKTERVDYIVTAHKSGKATLSFHTHATAGVLRGGQSLNCDPVAIDVWRGRDFQPRLIFRYMNSQTQPIFDVVFHSSEACKHLELELTFLDMNVIDFEAFDPVNADSIELLKDVRADKQRLKRFCIHNTQALAEVRVPFAITTDRVLTEDQWKTTPDITVFAQ